MTPTIAFHGAARTVTGSKHLLDLGHAKILVDCGLFQGPRDLRERNWNPFPFDPVELDAVVITHAHIDHMGLLPRLIREGFRGPIYATPGTIGLCKISLPDSGRLQEEEARYRNKHGHTRHAPALPLYTEADAYDTLKQLRPVRYFTLQDLPGGAKLNYLPAGHILGSAFAEIYFPNGERILMGGDLGRPNTPIITDPTPVDFAEYLVIESTYGDRVHSDENPRERVREMMHATMEDGGALIVPTFSIGRTQELLYLIHELQMAGQVPRMPIYLDSPMAVSATELYDRTIEDWDKDMKIRSDDGEDPLHPHGIVFVRDRNQSKALNANRGPMMIIAGSGMANAGRVVHHLRSRLGREDTIILFTGFQAEGTMGRELLDGAPEVEIFGDSIPVRARIERLTSLSAHADSDEIMTWLRGFKVPPKRTFLVHGEPGPQDALAERIQRELGWSTLIPEQGMIVELA